MKKIFRLSAIVTGAFAMFAGFTSCDKEDEVECCSQSYSYNGSSLKIQACADGSVSYTYNGVGYSYSVSYQIDDIAENWDYFKSYFTAQGASCS